MRVRTMSAVSFPGLVFALVCCFPFSLSPRIQGATISTPAPLAAYGGCLPPATEGVNVCAPFNVPSTATYKPPPTYPYQGINTPFQVIAAGTGGRGQVTYMELWADGKKVTQVRRTPFNEAITLPPGLHELTLIEVDETGAFFKSVPFWVLAYSPNSSTPCSEPDTPGVNVCQPYPNTCTPSGWVNIAAAAKAQTGEVKRMELWVGGNKIANFPGDHFETNMNLNVGTSTMSIFEIDYRGHWLVNSFQYDGPC